MRYKRSTLVTLTILVGVAAGCLILSGLPAEAIPLSQGAVFQIQEGAVPGSPSHLVTANALEFSYNSMAIQTAAPGSFTASGAASIGGFSLAGTAMQSILGGVGGYGMYATYTAAGTSVLLSPTELAHTYSSFLLKVFIDPNNSVIINPDGSVSGLNGDEYQIATGTLAPAALCAPNPSCGQDHVFLPPVLALGDFHFLLDFDLAPIAVQYFGAPLTPSYQISNFTGVIATMQFPNCSGNPPVCTNLNSTQQGSGDAFFPFAVPEPSSLLLLGAAILLFGVYVRHRKA